MIEFKEHIETIAEAVRNAEEVSKEILKFVFLCKDGDKIECTRSSYILLLSPYIRSIFESLNTPELDTVYISLSDFTAESVENLNKVTGMAWDDDDVWNSDDLDLFNILDINVGHPEAVIDAHEKSLIGVDILKPTEEDEIVLDSDSNGEDDDDEHEQAESRNKGINSLCPKCPKKFTGTMAKIKDNMRCHIGLDHLDTELETLVAKTFSDNNSCSICQKTFKTPLRQKKHLLLTHKVLARKLSTIIETAVADLEERKYLNSVSVTDTLNIFTEETENQLDKSRKTFAAKFPSLGLDKSDKIINLDDVEVNLESAESNSYNGGERLEKDESIKEFVSHEKVRFQCTQCDKNWPPSVKSFNTICKNHIMNYHLAEGFECQIRNYFRKTYCTLCKKNNTSKRIHLYSVHDILKKEVDKMYEDIKIQSKEKFTHTRKRRGRKPRAIVDENEVTNSETSHIFSEDLEVAKKPTKRGRKTIRNELNKKQKKTDVDDELDILLKDSDDENENEIGETSNIQELIMDDMSDGHLSDEDIIMDETKSDEEDMIFSNGSNNQKSDNNDIPISKEVSVLVENNISDEEYNDQELDNSDDEEIQRNLMLDQDISDDEETFDDPHDISVILGVKDSLRKELGLSDDEEDIQEDYSPIVCVEREQFSDDDESEMSLKQKILDDDEF